ncbi:hypothetical protein ABKN59_003139 [Abortiporus biennis]
MRTNFRSFLLDTGSTLFGLSKYFLSNYGLAFIHTIALLAVCSVIYSFSLVWLAISSCLTDPAPASGKSHSKKGSGGTHVARTSRRKSKAVQTEHPVEVQRKLVSLDERKPLPTLSPTGHSSACIGDTAVIYESPATFSEACTDQNGISSTPVPTKTIQSLNVDQSPTELLAIKMYSSAPRQTSTPVVNMKISDNTLKAKATFPTGAPRRPLDLLPLQNRVESSSVNTKAPVFSTSHQHYQSASNDSATSLAWSSLAANAPRRISGSNDPFSTPPNIARRQGLGPRFHVSQSQPPSLPQLQAQPKIVNDQASDRVNLNRHIATLMGLGCNGNTMNRTSTTRPLPRLPAQAQTRTMFDMSYSSSRPAAPHRSVSAPVSFPTVMPLLPQRRQSLPFGHPPSPVEIHKNAMAFAQAAYMDTLKDRLASLNLTGSSPASAKIVPPPSILPTSGASRSGSSAASRMTKTDIENASLNKAGKAKEKDNLTMQALLNSHVGKLHQQYMYVPSATVPPNQALRSPSQHGSSGVDLAHMRRGNEQAKTDSSPNLILQDVLYSTPNARANQKLLQPTLSSFSSGLGRSSPPAPTVVSLSNATVETWRRSVSNHPVASFPVSQSVARDIVRGILSQSGKLNGTSAQSAEKEQSLRATFVTEKTKDKPFKVFIDTSSSLTLISPPLPPMLVLAPRQNKAIPIRSPLSVATPSDVQENTKASPQTLPYAETSDANNKKTTTDSDAPSPPLTLADKQRLLKEMRVEFEEVKKGYTTEAGVYIPPLGVRTSCVNIGESGAVKMVRKRARRGRAATLAKEIRKLAMEIQEEMGEVVGKENNVDESDVDILV